VCMYVCMYVCTYVCMYVCMYVCVCVCIEERQSAGFASNRGTPFVRMNVSTAVMAVRG